MKTFENRALAIVFAPFAGCLLLFIIFQVYLFFNLHGGLISALSPEYFLFGLIIYLMTLIIQICAEFVFYFLKKTLENYIYLAFGYNIFFIIITFLFFTGSIMGSNTEAIISIVVVFSILLIYSVANVLTYNYLYFKESIFNINIYL